jgi:hypothetical protein
MQCAPHTLFVSLFRNLNPSKMGPKLGRSLYWLLALVRCQCLPATGSLCVQYSTVLVKCINIGHTVQ